MKHTSRATATVVAMLIALLASVVGMAPSSAAGYERGPDPTTASLQATAGPFAVSTTTVAAASGFGGADIYYPTDTSQGTFGGVAIAPGFTAYRSSEAWLARRVASWGFVVINIDTLTTLDQPAQRGTELLAALDYLTKSSSVRSRVDASRLAVMGHSMGGGGTLEAAKARPSLKAAVPLTPWNLDTSWPEVRTPTLIFGAQFDFIAPPASFSIPFYNSIPSSTPKGYIELAGQSHFAPNTTNTTIGEYSVAWLKRFVDSDTRYNQFLCPVPTGLAISASSGNCPH